jgi:hypothetical protein
MYLLENYSGSIPMDRWGFFYFLQLLLENYLLLIPDFLLSKGRLYKNI